MTRTTTGTVTLVGGGPGAWDLITLRGARALADADVILADHLGPGEEIDRILAEVGAPEKEREIIDVAKLPYGRQVAQEETNRLLVEHARAGKTVVRLKGGDPYVFGRGFEELQHCAAAGVECHSVPGVTSAVSVPAAAGVPVTHRGVVHSFTVVSGHVAPGDERSLVDWSALARVGGTIVVIMGVRHARAIAAALVAAGLDPATPAIAIQEGTLSGQVSVRATVATLADEMERAEIASPAVYVIGEVAGLG
ncbi:uroporphyrinogen-III C-methyltransferase [Corynebacterium guangdongense]|uniref:uroporphyrinogen-III C-methyltransferase n=1 Tax=Corynebacterium guangdongense TaxID=1783348 RepID=A0ABU1ZXD0_9CORY|nr:uroporphyrinogen-III C-methyltransferase [Corynebacterium guangdongense]MDR7329576.1 uroporphyrin-III C-methyltransferase [Corynebacterium guangdongense]WJZ18141.1 Uroporphyrinogen-III C-methyltransferase [Corynebacterium guangdongense]